MASWVILVGSPYGQGKCSTAATRIADALRELGSSVESSHALASRCMGASVAIVVKRTSPASTLMILRASLPLSIQQMLFWW